MTYAGTTDMLRRALWTPFKVKSKVEVYSFSTAGSAMNSGTWVELPINSGNIAYDRTADVQATLNANVLAVPRFNMSEVAVNLYQAYLRVNYGIEYPNGDIEWVPCGWYKVYESKDGEPSRVRDLVGYSLERAVQDSKFLSPTVVSGASAITVMTNLVKAALEPNIPGGTLVVSNTFTGSDVAVPWAVYDEDRWQAVRDLALLLDADIGFGRNGEFLIKDRPDPYATATYDPDNGHGLKVISFNKTTTREGAYNGVIARGESTTGSAPVQSVVVDDNPNSPTYWDGPFGKVPRIYSSPFLTTTGQCTAAGLALLSKGAGLRESIDLEVGPDPTLDTADARAFSLPSGYSKTITIQTITLDLGPNSPMTVTGVPNDGFSLNYPGGT